MSRRSGPTGPEQDADDLADGTDAATTHACTVCGAELGVRGSFCSACGAWRSDRVAPSGG